VLTDLRRLVMRGAVCDFSVLSHVHRCQFVTASVGLRRRMSRRAARMALQTAGYGILRTRKEDD
jgi:hypothetical protein